MSQQHEPPVGPAAEPLVPPPAGSPTHVPESGQPAKQTTAPERATATATAPAPEPEAAEAAEAAQAAEEEAEAEQEEEKPSDDLFHLATLTNAISADFRRAVLAGVMACVGLGLTYCAGGVIDSFEAPIQYFRTHTWLATLTSVVGAVLFLVFGSVAVRSTTREILKTVPDRLGDTRKNGLRWICLLLGYLVVIFGTLGALNVPIERLLLGGAVTGVILGIAAQQSLGNLFAGLVLLIVRPFSIGQPISLRSGPLGGVLTGEVADMNLTYVRLSTDKGEILLPNSTILSATIGPPNIFDP
ncbi:MAG TPA: mechanosensitive ion channel family protein [Actinocrinis sp.]|nr:mechanosensitive ion channel family protein [Actinocrinis sp.]